MSLFPRHSAFKPVAPPRPESRPPGLPSAPPKRVELVSANVTEVPNEVLERWFITLGELDSTVHLRTASASESIDDLRNEVYSYLRG